MADSEHELIRFGSRDYQPSTGRWTAKDPILFGGGLNLYEYVQNDPVNGTDRHGLSDFAAWSAYWKWTPQNQKVLNEIAGKNVKKLERQKLMKGVASRAIAAAVIAWGLQQGVDAAYTSSQAEVAITRTLDVNQSAQLKTLEALALLKNSDLPPELIERLIEQIKQDINFNNGGEICEPAFEPNNGENKDYWDLSDAGVSG
jgi:RHS repeat-associated protein